MHMDEIQLLDMKEYLLGMISAPWNLMDDSAMNVRTAKLTHYNLILVWVRQVSYFNPPYLMEPNS